MQTKATTVAQYMKELPEDRRVAVEAVRKVILKSLPKGYEEGMQDGMIGYYVPHSIYPQGYHCDAKQPLPFMALGNQKGYMSLHMMGLYMDGGLREKFDAAYAKAGKKLDAGKSCIRFKKSEDLALDVIGKTIASLPVTKYVAIYEGVLGRKR